MNDPRMTTLLQQLHARLEGTKSISDSDRELLKQLSADIHGLLAERPAQAEQPSILERLRTATLRLEVSHPELTETLAHVSKRLSDMGI